MAVLKTKPKIRLAPRSRGRPKAADLGALLKHVLLVAYEAFIENGYDGTTMVAIAAKARISKATMYTRFGSKEELFKAVVIEQLHSWREGNSAKNPVTVTHSLEDALRHHIEVQVRANRSSEIRALSTLLETEQRLFPELSQDIIANAYREGVDILTCEIKKYAELDQIPCRAPEEAAEMLRWMVGGGLRQIDVNRLPFELDDQRAFVDRIVKYAMAGRASW